MNTNILNTIRLIISFEVAGGNIKFKNLQANYVEYYKDRTTKTCT